MEIFTNEIKKLDQITAELEAVRDATRRETARQVAATAALADAEATYAGTLAADALKADGAGVKAARERVAVRRAEVEEQGERLTAVRTHLWRLATNSAKEAGAMGVEPLDQEAEEALKKFALEWERATTAFGLVMGRRKAIETVLVHPIRLQEPTPAGTSDVTALLPIHAKFTAFRDSLDAVSAVPGPSAMEGEEPDLFRAFASAYRTHQSAERARWDKIRRESRG